MASASRSKGSSARPISRLGRSARTDGGGVEDKNSRSSGETESAPKYHPARPVGAAEKRREEAVSVLPSGLLRRGRGPPPSLCWMAFAANTNAPFLRVGQSCPTPRSKGKTRNNLPHQAYFPLAPEFPGRLSAPPVRHSLIDGCHKPDDRDPDSINSAVACAVTTRFRSRSVVMIVPSAQVGTWRSSACRPARSRADPGYSGPESAWAARMIAIGAADYVRAFFSPVSSLSRHHCLVAG